MNKQLILIISAITASLLIHLGVFFVSFNLDSPPEPQKPEPIFEMIDAVLVEDEIAYVPPPPSKPEPEIIEEISEAVVPDEDVEEVPVEPEPPEPVIASDDVDTQENESVIQNQQTVFIPFYKVEKRPSFITQAELEYPVQAERNRIEGSVIVEADIDESGVLQKIKVVKSAGFGFDEAASAMLRNSTFSPAVMDGRPVGVRMRFTVKFQI